MREQGRSHGHDSQRRLLHPLGGPPSSRGAPPNMWSASSSFDCAISELPHPLGQRRHVNLQPPPRVLPPHTHPLAARKGGGERGACRSFLLIGVPPIGQLGISRSVVSAVSSRSVAWCGDSANPQLQRQGGGAQRAVARRPGESSLCRESFNTLVRRRKLDTSSARRPPEHSAWRLSSACALRSVVAPCHALAEAC